MRVRQRAFLIVKSMSLAPADITAAVGIAPTTAKAQGSRSAGPPPVPRANLWELESGVGTTATVEEHFEVLIPVIRSHGTRIRAIVSADETTAFLTIVREFEEGEEDFDESTYGLDPDSGIRRLGGQHPFLGWGLDWDVIELLAESGIGIDVDEYG